MLPGAPWRKADLSVSPETETPLTPTPLAWLPGESGWPVGDVGRASGMIQQSILQVLTLTVDFNCPFA